MSLFGALRRSLPRGGTAFALIAFASLLPAAPAAASTRDVTGQGFVVRQVVGVKASAELVWETLIKPAVWWNSDHTWSGNAANLSLDARAGGCFCEVLPNEASPRAAPRGSVEHMRVLYVEAPRALRMSGALGPLQSEAVNAVMTIQIKPATLSGQDGQEAEEGIAVMLEYTVGGYLRSPSAQIAASVDRVLGDQVKRLADLLGGGRVLAAQEPATGKEARVQGGLSKPGSDIQFLPLDNIVAKDDAVAAPEAEPGVPAMGNPNLPEGR